MTRTLPRILKGTSYRRCLITLAGDDYNAFLTSRPAYPTEKDSAIHSKPLRYRTVAIKDNICTKGRTWDSPSPETPQPSAFYTSCASPMLDRYESPFEATVVRFLEDAGVDIVGKTNMDEFAMGSTSTNNLVSVINPHRGPSGEAASAGGSSGGSSAAVAGGLAWGAIGTDTGGSVRLPAAYCGVVGFKPTYGLLSRWGVVSYAHSLDTVGVFARDVASAQAIFDSINMYDKKDPSSLPQAARDLFPKKTPGKLTIGIPQEYNLPSLHPAMRAAWSSAISSLQSAGHDIIKISLPRTKEALSTYYVIATAEAASNLARYDGVRFGLHHEMNEYEHSLITSRAEGFGDEVRRRILLGNYSLSSKFARIEKVRRLIQYSFDDVFSARNILHPKPSTSFQNKCDVILCPTTTGPAPELSIISNLTPVETYVNDVFTVPGSLAGLPAISIPAQVDGHIVGLQLMGQVGSDSLVLGAARQLEQILRA